MAELQVRWPVVPIVFCETRKLAEEWTYRYLAAAYSWALDEASTAPTANLELSWPSEIGGAGVPAPAPSTSEIRAWARANGIAVPDPGRLRPEVHQAWREAAGSSHL